MVSGKWHTQQTSLPLKVNHIFIFQVGLTDYKEHMGTNLSPEVDQWVGEGEHRLDNCTLNITYS